MLAASPLNDGARAGATPLEPLELEELEELGSAEVPFVALLSVETRALRLESDAKAAYTSLPLEHVSVWVPEPATKLTAAH